MPAEKIRAILLFGMPGAGKGTQGAILGQIPGFVHCSSGDILRSLNGESPVGKEVFGYTSKGSLVPDELTIRVWKSAMDGAIARGELIPAQEVLILDGIPRTVRQSEILQDHVDVLGIVHLSCFDRNAMVQRIRRRALLENRADDANEKIIRNRFEIYRVETAPVLEFYPENLVTEVNADGSPVEVLQRVLQTLVTIQNAQLSDAV